MQETYVWSLIREDFLEKEMATHSRISWTEEPGRLQSTGSLKSGRDLVTKQQIYTSDFFISSQTSIFLIIKNSIRQIVVDLEQQSIKMLRLDLKQWESKPLDSPFNSIPYNFTWIDFIESKPSVCLIASNFHHNGFCHSTFFPILFI